LWSGLLNRAKAGGALAILNALLGLATIVPALTPNSVAVMASGLLFGAVFLSVVASSTALVRHNLPASQWATGISAFTMVFASGQIIGPVVVGWEVAMEAVVTGVEATVEAVTVAEMEAVVTGVGTEEVGWEVAGSAGGDWAAAASRR
jgi:hypothetical protein